MKSSANPSNRLEALLAERGGSIVFALAALVLLAGVGMREPWPADEPRFALIARDMLASGQWLVPTIGGDLYADKPPLHFWLLALSIELTGSVRAGFLLPTALAGFATLALVYDLAHRLYDRATAATAALVLLCTLQFAQEFKAAQIDPTLTMLTTLSLYALLRHLLLGPAWGWYALGGFAAGLGVVAKGVGFLPLLVLVPYAGLALRGWPLVVRGGAWRWALAPLAAIAAIAAWLVPLLVATASSPRLAAYRNDILFGQTVDRYLAAAGHLHGPWYFVLEVIPWAWLPVSVALPWLVKPWREQLRARDATTALLLAWIVIVIAFFSLSSGKRGVYVLPALPALALAVAPHVPAVLARRAPQTIAWALLAAVALTATGAVIYFGATASALPRELDGFTGSLAALLAPLAVFGVGCTVLFRPTRGLLGLAAFLMGVWLIVGWLVWPQLDDVRSGKRIMERAYAALPPDAELGVAAQKETLLLHAQGPLTNFGHRRTDVQQEQADAALWLSGDADRFLIVRGTDVQPCFAGAPATPLGHAHGIDWQLVPHTAATPKCVRRGVLSAAIPYRWHSVCTFRRKFCRETQR